MLVLTFSTGIADAVGYLGLDRVFTGNMTGNVVILGMALTGADNLPVVGPGIALTAFLGGAATGGRASRRSGTGWSTSSTRLLFAVAIAFAVCACILAFNDVAPGGWSGYVVIGVLAWAMGLQASVARMVGVKDVTTVVVTSTLTGLAADSQLAGGNGQAWGRRVAAVLLIGAGAGVGALLLTVDIWVGVASSATLAAVVSACGHRYGGVDSPS